MMRYTIKVRSRLPLIIYQQIERLNRVCFPNISQLDTSFESVYTAEHKNVVWAHAILYRDSFIANVCVSPEHRNKGVGTALLQRILKDHPKRTLKLWVDSNNQNARELYHKLGFKELSGTRTRNNERLMSRKGSIGTVLSFHDSSSTLTLSSQSESGFTSE